MKEVNKDFIFDFILVLVMWIIATPLAICAYEMPQNSILEGLSGTGSAILFIAGIITLVFAIIRRLSRISKND